MHAVTSVRKGLVQHVQANPVEEMQRTNHLGGRKGPYNLPATIQTYLAP